MKLLKKKQYKYFKYKHLTINIKREHEPEREQGAYMGGLGRRKGTGKRCNPIITSEREMIKYV